MDWFKVFPRKTLAALALAFTVATAPIAAPPSQAADFNPADVVVEDPTTVTVMGLADSEVGDTVPVVDLIEKAEEVGQDIQDELLGAGPEEPGAQSGGQFALPAIARRASLPIKTAADPAYSIYSQWWDNKYIKVAVRNGTTSWGWQHLQKHNVSLAMLQKTTKFPRSRYMENGSQIYVTPANQYTCWLASCRIDRTMDVKVVVNPTRLNDGAPRGVISAYCLGPTVCPTWVRQVAG